MLSVFITPCTKPTRIQCATNSADRSHTCPNHSSRSAGPEPPISGKSRRMVKSTSFASTSTSPRDAGNSKFPKRMNEGATRQTTAPGSLRGWPS